MEDVNHFNPYIVFAHQGKCDKKEIFMERMCMWYELEMLYEAEPGAGVITLDQLIPVQECVLFLRRPGDIVRGIAPYAYVSIVFDARYDPEFDEYYKQNPLEHPVDIPFLCKLNKGNCRSFEFLESIPRVMHPKLDFEQFKPMFQIVNLMRNPTQVNCLQAKAKLMDFLAKLSNVNAEANGIYSVYPQTIADAQKFMSQHYQEALTLERIADSVSLNKEYFCRHFKKQLGISPISYLQQVRIYHAKLKLITDTTSVESIALSCGFRSVNYFYTVFKAYTGMTPESYRKHQW